MAAQARKKRKPTPYSLDTCVVRLTTGVKDFITSKAEWGESIDQTLRRLFKLGDWKPNGKKDTSKRRNAHGR